MKTSDPSWIKPALALVGKFDPGMKAEMSRCPWYVYALGNGNTSGEYALAYYAHTQNPNFGEATIGSLQTAFGVTYNDLGPSFPNMSHSTWLNVPAIEAQAGKLRIPVAEFAAAVLVHEFTHFEGATGEDGEDIAFHAGTEYARKTGRRSLLCKAQEDENANLQSEREIKEALNAAKAILTPPVLTAL